MGRCYGEDILLGLQVRIMRGIAGLFYFPSINGPSPQFRRQSAESLVRHTEVCLRAMPPISSNLQKISHFWFRNLSVPFMKPRIGTILICSVRYRHRCRFAGAAADRRLRPAASPAAAGPCGASGVCFAFSNGSKSRPRRRERRYRSRSSRFGSRRKAR